MTPIHEKKQINFQTKSCAQETRNNNNFQRFLQGTISTCNTKLRDSCRRNRIFEKK